MLTLTIDNPTVENIVREGFNANKEKFLEFIQESYQKVKHLDGTAKLLTEEESSVIMNVFMKDLKTKHAHPQR